MTTVHEPLESTPFEAERIMYGIGALAALATNVYTVSRIVYASNNVIEGASNMLWQAIPIASVACLGAVCFKNAIAKNTSA